jgi:hypothetical protein
MTTPTAGLKFALSEERELDRILDMKEVERVSGLSDDVWKREHPDKIIKLSKRRIGVRLRDALMLPDKK